MNDRASAPPLRALVVSYTFPPVGGVGVQRMSKLVKYLPRHGVEPTVLTASNPSAPLRDEALLRDIPAGVRVLRVPTLEPGYGVKQAVWSQKAAVGKPKFYQRLKAAVLNAGKSVLVPDPQVLWLPAAEARLLWELVRRPPDVVLISGPPFSPFLLAPLCHLSQRSKVIVDYRDEWSMYRNEYEMTGGTAAWAGERLEGWILKQVDRVVTATPAFRDNLLAAFPFLDPERVVTVPNGYDPADFRNDLPAPDSKSERFVLTFAGTTLRLTSPRGLFGAIRRLAERAPSLARKLEVHFIGRVVQTEERWFEGMHRFGVRRLGYMPRADVIERLARSHAALVLLDDVPGVERMYPGKLFELLYLRRPTLIVAPDGALRSLARDCRFGEICAPRDEAAIAEILHRWLDAFERGQFPTHAAPVGIERFDRRVSAGRFAEVMRSAVSPRQESPEPRFAT